MKTAIGLTAFALLILALAWIQHRLDKKCPACHGTGWIDAQEEIGGDRLPCPWC